MDGNLAERWHALQFDVQRSIRYHERRRAFFSMSNKLSEASAILFGSAAVVSLLKEWEVAVIVASIIVTVLATLNLVFGTVAMSYKHADLGKRFIDLHRKMLTSQATEDQYLRLVDERLTIERDEPPIKRAVDLMCYNEMLYAGGYDESNRVDVPLFKQLTGHFFNWYVGPPKKPKQDIRGRP